MAAQLRSIGNVQRGMSQPQTNEEDGQYIDVFSWSLCELGDDDAGEQSRCSFEGIQMSQVRAPSPSRERVAVASWIANVLLS